MIADIEERGEQLQQDRQNYMYNSRTSSSCRSQDIGPDSAHHKLKKFDNLVR